MDEKKKKVLRSVWDLAAKLEEQFENEDDLEIAMRNAFYVVGCTETLIGLGILTEDEDARIAAIRFRVKNLIEEYEEG